MAPKSKAIAAPVKASKTSGKNPVGLHLTAAQWSAYDKAYNAVSNKGYTALSASYRKQAIQGAATALVKRRLAVAARDKKRAAAAKVAATRAKGAFGAAKLALKKDKALQSKALIAKAHALVDKDRKAADSLQAKASADKKFAADAVKRELTPKEALSAETAKFNKAAKVAKKAGKAPVKKKSKLSAATVKAEAGIKTASVTAGLAAARKVPKSAKLPASRTAPCPEEVQLSQSYDWYYGHPDGRDCVAAAIASSLLHDLGLHLTPWRYQQLARVLGDAPQLGHALHIVKNHWSVCAAADLKDFDPDPVEFTADGCVIGFTTKHGPHAALYLGGGMIASWGEVLPLKDVILGAVEESWDLRWVKRLGCHHGTFPEKART